MRNKANSVLAVKNKSKSLVKEPPGIRGNIMPKVPDLAKKRTINQSQNEVSSDYLPAVSTKLQA